MDKEDFGLIAGDLATFEIIIRQAFYLGFCVSRESFNAEQPQHHLAPKRLFTEDYYDDRVENLPRKDQDWDDYTFGDHFKSLQDEAVDAVILRLVRKEG